MQLNLFASALYQKDGGKGRGGEKLDLFAKIGFMYSLSLC